MLQDQLYKLDYSFSDVLTHVGYVEVHSKDKYIKPSQLKEKQFVDRSSREKNYKAKQRTDNPPSAGITPRIKQCVCVCVCIQQASAEHLLVPGTILGTGV